MDVLFHGSDGGLLLPPTHLQDTFLSCRFVLAGQFEPDPFSLSEKKGEPKTLSISNQANLIM